jgi:hypothetical protein
MNARLLPLCITIAACAACGYDPYHYTYLRDVPPRAEICGTWVVDFDGTTWRAATSLPERALADGQHAHLDLNEDGRFSIEGLPDFSFGAPLSITSITFLESASGTWRTEFDPMNEWSYLWLDFDEVNGVCMTEKVASVNFRRQGQEYLLHVIVGDPDSGDALLMRKRKE